MKTYARHAAIYMFLKRFLARLLAAAVFGFKGERVRMGNGPYLVIANHVTDFDPILLGDSFDRHMYFVAGEHVFRGGAVMRFAVWAFAPICRVKGTTDAAAAVRIIRTLKAGASVCLFAEGNTTFNGVSGSVFESTGRLAKLSEATLVTYRLEGGYLASPRWGRGLRRGPVRGRAVNLYTPERLRAMDAGEITAAINADIYEDAFLRQAQTGFRYRGRRPAERLELALYMCPKCGRIGTLQSGRRRFFCTCGLEAVYTDAGFFEGEDLPFDNVRDWDAWQTGRMAELAASRPWEPVFSDEGYTLSRVSEAHETKAEARGRLAMSAFELVCGGRSFPVDEISDLAIHGASSLVFTVPGGYYELRPEKPACSRKYYTFFNLLKSCAAEAAEITQ